jgi:hypothetical protein
MVGLRRCATNTSPIHVSRAAKKSEQPALRAAPDQTDTKASGTLIYTLANGGTMVLTSLVLVLVHIIYFY